jgi:Protein of unknown function (DUF5661)
VLLPAAWRSNSSTAHDPHTNVTDDDPLVTGKIALAQLNAFSDYYVRLKRKRERERERERENVC